MTKSELKTFLDEKVEEFNTSAFIEEDPICIPHQFSKKEDIEIIGFLVATIAWGKRQIIINNGHKLVDIMGGQPHDFILNASPNDLKDLKFVHRTFNAIDLTYFINALQGIYKSGSSLEEAFSVTQGGMNLKIAGFRETFLSFGHEKRTEKHISNPLKNSSAKRLNMYLRWMVRNDKKRVDFGIWNGIKPSELYCPLDVHTGNVGRKLGFITRKANDWKALEELMVPLRKMDINDPVKYDFALFGLGVYEGF
jgi:uncharacterized protein (TIGR02757 family)